VASTVFPLVDARVLRFDGVKPRVKFVAAPPGEERVLMLVAVVAVAVAVPPSPHTLRHIHGLSSQPAQEYVDPLKNDGD
jgi:hypothetical protein